MTNNQYKALVAKAKAGTLNDEERETLRVEADARVDAEYARQAEDD